MEFNWEELYLNLHNYGNKGQRTGPWDFNLLDANKPLIPSYGVNLNGSRKGFWYFQRVSLEDIAQRKMRGRFAFHVEQEGESLLELTPYRKTQIQWSRISLETDPEDSLEKIPFSVPVETTRLPAALWAKKGFWNQLRDQLHSTHCQYARPLEKSFQWARDPAHNFLYAFPLLLADWRLNKNQSSLDLVLKNLQMIIGFSHWGNPCEDGYGHNGDIAAALALKTVAWSFLALEDVITPGLKKQVLAKLKLQGNRFFEMALLNRDYWGGSLLQDHGWRSMFDFGTASLHLLNVLPDARLWASYVIPRIARALNAIPRDGVIPQSSYGSLYLYLDELVQYRDTLLACGGNDIFREFPFREIIRYVMTVLHHKDLVMIAAVGQSDEFMGGGAFFNRIASLFDDSNAAYLASRLLEVEGKNFHRPSQEKAYFQNPLWGVISYDSEISATRTFDFSPLTYFEDSGLVQYRNELQNVTLTVHCAPWCGYHAYQHAAGPSDQMGLAPGAGHFILYLGRYPRLTTPESKYSLRTHHRSCLLIDDMGQHGDIGYPMSIPRKRHDGERIESVLWNAVAKQGSILLDLAAAYPEQFGILQYTRQFIIKSDAIICRDHVKLARPRRLSWLFQGRENVRLSHEKKLTGIFGKYPIMRISPVAMEDILRASIHETDTVHGYLESHMPYHHVRYDSVTLLSEICVDFLLSWETETQP